MKKTLLLLISCIYINSLTAQTTNNCGLTLTCTSPASAIQEHVIDGNFSDFNGQNPSFTSDLPQNSTCDSGSYWVGNNPRAKCTNSLWINGLWDWNPNNATGSYLIIDGRNGNLNTVVWQQNMNLVQGQTYLFSFNVLPCISSTNCQGQNLNVSIDNGGGRPIQQVLNSASGTYTEGANNWNNVCNLFTYTGPTGPANLTITQQGSNGNNDYGIDGISLTGCCEPPSLNITGDTTICPGETTTLTANGGVSWEWTGPFGFTANTQSITVSNAVFGGNYTVTATGPTGCQATQSVTVTQLRPNLVVITSSNTNLCAGGTTEQLTAIPAGGVWSGNGVNATTGAFDPTIAGQGSHTITYTVTNNFGCTNSTNTTIDVNPLPIVTTTLDENVCLGENMLLGSNQFTSYFSPNGGVFTGSNVSSQVINLPPPINSSVTIYSFSSTTPGNHDVLYTHTDPVTGCANTTIGHIFVETPPIVTFNPIPNLSLCSIAQPFFVDATTTGTNPTETWSISPTTTGFNTVTGEFDPNIAGVGTYTITYRAVNGCGVDEASQTFTVDSGEYWHQTTKNSQANEGYFDVVTDINGNVYAVGIFTGVTTLDGGGNPDITITPNGTGAATYLAKYDECANLQWVADSSNSTNIDYAITLDETADKVYITGNYQNSANFSNAQTNNGITNTPITLSINTTAAQSGYVAQYDMNSGDLYFVEEIQIAGSNYTNCTSMTVNESNGDIYVGGQFGGNSPSSDRAMFIQKYSPTTTQTTSNTLGNAVWDILGIMEENKVNDMDYDEIYDRLWFTGDFARDFGLIPGGAVEYGIKNTKLTQKEGFIAGYDDLGGSVARYLFKGGRNNDLVSQIGQGSASMSGQGVGVDELTGNPYFTGYYGNSLGIQNIDPFGFITAGISTDQLPGIGVWNQTYTNAYFIGYDIQSNTAWVRHATTVNGGASKGKALAVKDDQVFFTGTFIQSDLEVSNATGSSLTIPYANAASRKQHSFVTGYSTTGIVNWGNATEAITANDEHLAQSIAANDNGQIYLAGYYTGNMDYIYGNPASGPLASTSSAYNGFILRTEQLSGALKSNQSLSSINIHKPLIKQDLIGTKIYPNPTSGILNIQIDSEIANGNLQILDLTGKVIYATNKLNSNKMTFDLSEYSKGVYLIKITTNENTIIKKVVFK